jgi:hypothetical protein
MSAFGGMNRRRAGTACGMDGAVSLKIQGLKPLAKITRSRWDRKKEGIYFLKSKLV